MTSAPFRLRSSTISRATALKSGSNETPSGRLVSRMIAGERSPKNPTFMSPACSTTFFCRVPGSSESRVTRFEMTMGMRVAESASFRCPRP